MTRMILFPPWCVCEREPYDVVTDMTSKTCIDTVVQGLLRRHATFGSVEFHLVSERWPSGPLAVCVSF